MCEICRQNPCCPACPNHRQKVYGECYSCGAIIHVGDIVYKLDGETYCEECIDHARFEAEVDEDADF